MHYVRSLKLLSYDDGTLLIARLVLISLSHSSTLDLSFSDDLCVAQILRGLIIEIDGRTDTSL